nr:immunoglobulin heavy chain junction region [Mus musculus]
CARLGLVYW